MPVTFSPLKFMSAINQRYSHHRELEGQHVLSKIFEEAAPLIEKRLASPEHLKQYTWLGKQAFYDDERAGMKEIRGGMLSPGYGDHLKDQFIVIPHESGEGFEITNTKTVRSSLGKYNLFELLWHGWGAYRIPPPVVSSLFKGKQKGAPLNKDVGKYYFIKPMTYYYRYAGSWFYNAKSRAGFTPSLHDKFKQYVMDAVDWGVEHAIKNMLERGDGSDEIRKIFEGMQ